MTIEIKENFKISAFILSNLPTKYNDEILESTRMIYLSVNDKKRNTLSLSPDKKIRVQIPQNKSNDNSKIFLRTRVENGTINWQNIEESSKFLIPYPIAFLTKIAPWRFLESDIVNFYEEKFKNNKKYWKTPEGFNSERFFEENRKDIIPYYMPFVAELRLCIGNDFAMYEMVLTVNEIIKRFDISTDNNDIEMNPLIALKSVDAKLSFSKKEKIRFSNKIGVA